MVLALLLQACSSMQYTSNGEKYYLKNRNGANVVVPPPLSAANISSLYNLPPQNTDPRISHVPPA